MENLKYRHDIDGLRAIAVLSVMFFHLGIPYFNGGFVGVDVFFVISGFLITRIINNEIKTTNKIKYINFFIRRFRRLYPALVTVVLLTAISSILFFSPSSLQRFGGELTSTIGSLSNFLFWIEADYFDVSSKVKPLLHTWSLSIEVQFYLIWPFILLFILKKKRKWLIIILLVLFSLYLNIIFSDGSIQIFNQFLPTLSKLIKNGKSTIFYLLPFRIYEFIIGAMLVWLTDYKVKSKFVLEIVYLLGFIFIILSIVIFNEKLLFPYFYAILPCFGTAFLIYSGEKSLSSKLLTNKIFIFIGLTSYSVYLIHWPLIVFWQYIKGSLSNIDKIIIITLSFILGNFSYKYIEKPFRINKLNISRPIFKYSIIVTFVIIIAIGISIKFNSGWKWRIKNNDLVDVENTGDSLQFHKKFYGGAPYPSYGPVNKKLPADIVLIGDSHGKQYAEGIYKLFAKPNGYTMYIASGTSCFHLPGFTRKTKGYNWNRNCPKALKKAIDFINKAKSPPIVIMSHSWLSQMKIADLLDNQGNSMNIDIEINHIITGILKLKQKIAKSTLVVIGQVPTTGGFNLYDIFSRPHLPFITNKNVGEFMTSKINPKYIEFNTLLKKAAESTNKFIFLDPHDVLCDNYICQNVNNNNKKLIYSDKTHLSIFGSIFVINGFLPKLLQINSLK